MTASKRVFDAPVVQKGPVPAYKVVEHDVPVTRTLSRFDEKTRQIVKEEVIIQKGYMVIFPRGHSNFYESLEALEAAGFGEVVPLITMNGEAEVNNDLPVSATQRKIEKRV